MVDVTGVQNIKLQLIHRKEEQRETDLKLTKSDKIKNLSDLKYLK